jgi:hypothetical protein
VGDVVEGETAQVKGELLAVLVEGERARRKRQHRRRRPPGWRCVVAAALRAAARLATIATVTVRERPSPR